VAKVKGGSAPAAKLAAKPHQPGSVNVKDSVLIEP
jgi:hypothetical protein